MFSFLQSGTRMAHHGPSLQLLQSYPWPFALLTNAVTLAFAGTLPNF